jgi:hypothetical protein
MKVYNEILQQSDEWKALKWGKVGGSSADKLMVAKLNEAAIIDQLIYEQTEEIELFDDYTSPEMQRGNDLEPFAREALQQETGLTFIVPGWIQSEIELLGLSPDGVTKDFKIACELKCPGGKNHTKYLRNPMAMVIDYAWQVVAYFAVIEGLEKIYLCSCRPESKIKTLLKIELTRESEIYTSGAAKATPEKISVLAERLRARAVEAETLIKNEIERISF